MVVFLRCANDENIWRAGDVGCKRGEGSLSDVTSLFSLCQGLVVEDWGNCSSKWVDRISRGKIYTYTIYHLYNRILGLKWHFRASELKKIHLKGRQKPRPAQFPGRPFSSDSRSMPESMPKAIEFISFL